MRDNIEDDRRYEGQDVSDETQKIKPETMRGDIIDEELYMISDRQHCCWMRHLPRNRGQHMDFTILQVLKSNMTR